MREKEDRGGLLKPSLLIIHLKTMRLSPRDSQWGLRGQEGFEKYQEVKSMTGIVAFRWAETPSRKVTYCRTDDSLTPTAFWKPTVSF